MYSIFEDTDTQPLTCNTEKDKHGRLNFRTAGNNNIVRLIQVHTNHNRNYNAEILAGMRPCGIVLLSGVKTQVYGCLHDYYLKNPAAAKGISRKSMISNVCHLCCSHQ